ncbi:GNAT family N-acetyltransferase [Acinetobacter sp. C26M]|uniref:GNAT family N-acetyltransferase n=1 Tax=unclassified Acinetobacter TaxID=196816 RepID=UPI001422DF0F|nr:MULTISPECIES: GNAT family N-acetyltransferase [unclassified Acinetobacter]NIE96937.1 GNAT family N-acetyltransferase [Acinetobacter sp. Tr-809]USA45463.1 GNAT family N-acetyltransferase [Acinetobacter sp. C26M]USA48965.1 GNAT family N-acetyltransferase [Acinetobacter sp. C26G]
MEIKLEKFHMHDFNLYYQLVGNEKVMAMITERAIPEEEAKKDFQLLIINNQLHPNFGHFKILDVNTNEYIGLAKLEIKNLNDSEVELGYMLLPSYWGKGIARKVSQQLLSDAKKQNSIHRIFAIIDPQNIASRKILTSQGFVHTEFKDYDGLAGEILELKQSLI